MATFSSVAASMESSENGSSLLACMSQPLPSPLRFAVNMTTGVLLRFAKRAGSGVV